MKDSFKKKVAAIIAALILLCIASGAVYLRKTYVKIEGHIYKTDVKEISPDLKFTKIREINKCTEVEKMYLSFAYENAISSFADFEKLSFLSLSLSSVTSYDSKKISTFSNLKELYIYCTDIYLEGFNNSNLSCVKIMNSDVKNFDSLAECLSLRSISLADTVVDDNIINSDGSYVMKDSKFLSSFDNVTELVIYVDSIEDVSGICEMDSLKSLTVSEGSISDEAIHQLDEKGIKVTQKKW
jgi:Leucine-rich repeat (LRR) protein